MWRTEHRLPAESPSEEMRVRQCYLENLKSSMLAVGPGKYSACVRMSYLITEMLLRSAGWEVLTVGAVVHLAKMRMREESYLPDRQQHFCVNLKKVPFLQELFFSPLYYLTEKRDRVLCHFSIAACSVYLIVFLATS